MSLSETVRKLRRDAAKLEAEAIEQDRRDSYLAALLRERAGVAAQLAHGLRLGDKREVIQGGGPFHTAVKTGTEIAAEAEQSLVEIDAEIAKTEKEIERLLQDAKVGDDRGSK
jgi:hypothetical protein